MSMLPVPPSMLSVFWVMAAQALSGIAKDLNKMSDRSSIKLLVSDPEQGRLYTWVALLTGSKNTLKGVGFSLGGALLTLVGFRGAATISERVARYLECPGYLARDEHSEHLTLPLEEGD